MTSLKRPPLDLLVNVAILVTCGALLITVLQHRSTYSRSASAEAPRSPFRVGEAAEALPGVTYGAAKLQLVLFLKSTCGYCTNSIPFYRRVRDEAKRQESVRLIAVSSEPSGTLQEYLKRNGLTVDQVVSQQHKALGTPTVVLVDSAGIIKGVWEGQQGSAEEDQILRAIRS